MIGEGYKLVIVEESLNSLGINNNVDYLNGFSESHSCMHFYLFLCHGAKFILESRPDLKKKNGSHKWSSPIGLTSLIRQGDCED